MHGTLQTLKVALARAFACCLVVLVWLLVSAGPEGRPARIFWTRLALETLAAHAVLACVVHRERVRAYLTEFFSEARGPLNLAVFRVAFFAIVLAYLPYDEVARMAKMSRSLVVPPVGIGWLMPHLPIDEHLGLLACHALFAGAVLGMIGLFSRTAAAVVALAGFYAFGLPNFFGKVHHSHHHLVLFAAVLAASRCGDALALDAWLARRRGAPEAAASAVYALPLKLLWLMMSAFYFFPGFWKLWTSGIDWVASDNMVRTMQYKWYELGGLEPALRPDRYPLLMRLGALVAVGFELLFPVAVFVRGLRAPVFLTGFVFHSMAEWLLAISFRPLQLCYVMFVDWERVLGRETSADARAPEPRAARPVALVGGLSIALLAYFGAAHHYLGWPFSMYPTMEHINESPHILSLRLAAEDERGPMPAMESALAEVQRRLDPSRWRHRVYRFFDTERVERRLWEVRAIWGECVHLYPELARAKRLKVYQVVDSLIPEEIPKNPVRERLLYEIPL